ncbi:MAG: PEP-CTERM sorting domain-containing protein [Chloroflexaceae bacterium]|nr:PEP-CTERM sorting domain-containing protein [Chloroflexaceae bacterium]
MNFPNGNHFIDDPDAVVARITLARVPEPSAIAGILLIGGLGSLSYGRQRRAK